MTAAAALLEVENLSVRFQRHDGSVLTAVEDSSFRVARGRTLGIVGESGSGKSVTSLAIMGLLPTQTARVGGRILFEGRDLATLPKRELADLRGNRMAMIFQEPMTSLNPSFTCGDQIAEVVIRHRGLSKADAKTRAIELLDRVRIPNARQRFDEYPHRLSGGMRQRVMIAMALACDPALLIADEPTTALDVTIQAQILELMRTLREASDAAIILITHDLGVVAEVADDVAVMYAGQIVEEAPVSDLFRLPQHPYTIGLLGALPRLNERRDRLTAIPGTVPDLSRPPPGCRFAPRCAFADAACKTTAPPLATPAPGRRSRCLKTPLEALVA
jgi:peptide/nickel transport system ATP-binding protein